MKRVWAVFLTILALDALSKWATHTYLHPFGAAFPLFQLFGIDLSLHHVINRGMAWGVGSHLQQLILIARIAVIAGLAIYLFFSSAAKARRYPLLLIMAGGLGNILDYFLYGHVIDMFHFTLWGYSCPIFNLADLTICLGIALLLWKSRQRVIRAAQ